MSKPVDTSTKRIISLAPTEWVRWLTGDDTLEALEVLSGEFQWVSRATDALIKVTSPAQGNFLIVTEIQLHPSRKMPRRMRAYAALAEERYGLSVLPIVVNILQSSGEFADRYHSEFMGLVAHQDFRIVNMWQLDVELAFRPNLTPLLPFTPILRGGQDLKIISKAVARLRADEHLSDLENLLAFFARIVLDRIQFSI